MRLIEPAELSAFLDGELDPDRAREIATALASDSELREEYGALAKADVVWKAAADSALFKPSTQLSTSKVFASSPLAFAAVLIALIALCVTAKLGTVVVWNFVLHAVALAIALPWIIRMARETQNQL